MQWIEITIHTNTNGADAMAESGADYQTILTHYYTGVTVEVFTG